MTSLKIIGQRIARHRKLLGVTQDELAGRAEIDRSFLSEIENGHKNLSVMTLIKLSDALGLKASTLLENQND